MVFVGSADEFVVACTEKIPHTAYFPRDLINILLRCDALGFSLLLYLDTVFICAGEEENVVSLHSSEPSDGVRKNDFENVADVRLARCVGDSCGQIKFFFHLGYSLLVVFEYIIEDKVK